MPKWAYRIGPYPSPVPEQEIKLCPSYFLKIISEEELLIRVIQINQCIYKKLVFPRVHIYTPLTFVKKPQG